MRTKARQSILGDLNLRKSANNFMKEIQKKSNINSQDNTIVDVGIKNSSFNVQTAGARPKSTTLRKQQNLKGKGTNFNDLNIEDESEDEPFKVLTKPYQSYVTSEKSMSANVPISKRHLSM